MSQPIDTATVEIVPDFSQFSRETRSGVETAMRQLQSEVGAALGTVERDAAEAGGAIGRDFQLGADRAEVALREVSTAAKTNMAQVAASSEAAGTSIGSKLGGVLSTIKTALLGVGLVAGAGLGALTAMGLKSAASLEQTQVAFDSLLGSAAEGQRVFDSLKTFAAVTPFELGDITPLAQKFLAFSGTVGMTKDQLQGFLTTVGNLASVTGGGAESLKSAGLAFSHIASGGKVSLEDINILSDAFAGFNGIAAIAADRGITTAEAMKQISAGEIDATSGINALLKGMDQFPGAAGAMEKQSLTLLGVFSTFKDTIGQALSGAFQPVIPAIKDSLNTLTPILGTALGQLAPALGNVLAALLPLIGGLVQAIVPLLTPLLDALSQTITLIAPAIAPIGTALGSIATAIAPLLPMLGELVAVVAETFGPVLQAIAPLVGALVPVVGALGGVLAQLLVPLAPILVDIANALAAILGPAADIVVKILQLLAPLIGKLVPIFGRLLSPILALVKPFVALFEQALAPLLPIVGQLIDPIVQLVTAFLPLADLLGALLLAVMPILVPFIKLDALLISFLASKAIVPLIQALAIVITQLLKPIELLVQPLGDIGTLLRGIDWGALATTIGNALVTAWNAVVDFFANIGSTIYHGVGDAKDAIVAGFDAMVAYIAGLPQRAINALASLAVQLAQWAGGIVGQAYDLGVNLVLGVVHGIENNLSAIWHTLENGLGDALSKAKHFLGINSPSSVWADEVGQQIPAGVEQGATANPVDLQGMLDGITPNGAGVNHAPLGGLGNIIVNVTINGATTPEQARRVGQAAGAGVADALARRNVGLAVRTT